MSNTPRGFRGSWIANFNGRELACIHSHWLEGNQYKDHQKWSRGEKLLRWFRAVISEGKVLITEDAVDEVEWGTAFKRTGYSRIAVVEEFTWNESGTVTLILKDIQFLKDERF